MANIAFILIILKLFIYKIEHIFPEGIDWLPHHWENTNMN